MEGRGTFILSTPDFFDRNTVKKNPTATSSLVEHISIVYRVGEELCYCLKGEDGYFYIKDNPWLQTCSPPRLLLIPPERRRLTVLS